MLKRLLSALLCAFAILAAVGCTEKKTDDEVKKPEIQNEELVQVELNIKPLEKVKEKTLSEAASALGFENNKLFHAFANAIGKKPQEVTQEDVYKVHYIALGPGENYEHSLFVGYVDYVDMCLTKQADDKDFSSKLSEKVMMSEFEYDENDSLSDLGQFKNVEMFELYDVQISDVSFMKNYNNLICGFFGNNGITDISVLEGYNPSSRAELDFTGNEISDWTPVEQIKDKIIVFYDMASGFRITLESFLEQTQTPEKVPEISEESKENADKDDEYFVVDENGNPADFESLFG